VLAKKMLPRRDVGGEGDTVVDEGQGGRPCDVLPLGGGGTACTHTHTQEHVCKYINIFSEHFHPTSRLD